MAQAKVIIVSNRLPVSVKKEHGKLVFAESTGGLATGLSSIPKNERLWIGWPGIVSEQLDRKDKATITAELKKRGCVPVFLTQRQVTQFYDGYSNQTLWPLFHYFPSSVSYRRSFWDAYRDVNADFGEVVLQHSQDARAVWVHDYQLMLLPAVLRPQLPKTPIGFFLHIPFPTFELFRLLPQRRELLDGLLGADLIGFHTHEYARHFLSCALNLGGYDHSGNLLNIGNRTVRVDAFPIGIDTEKFMSLAADPKMEKAMLDLAREFGGRRIILSVDRLDYSKGIPERLAAYSHFLKEHPELHDKVVLLMIAVPSRTDVRRYKDLRDEVEQAVSRINGEYGNVEWSPIRYISRNLPQTELIPLYRYAAAALVTPLRDGMNLVAKEYAASQTPDDAGVLILSEMTGSAVEMHDAILINPHDRLSLASAIYLALTMPPEERAERLKHLQERLKKYTIIDWAQDFLQQLTTRSQNGSDSPTAAVTPEVERALAKEFKAAKSRLLLLDYDGTLTSYANRYERNPPPAALKRLLRKLSDQKGTEVVIVSGRNRENLESWFNDLPVSLVAEHGACTRRKGQKKWTCKPQRDEDWRPEIMALWQPFERRTPGALIETKEYSLVWHYRRVPAALAKMRLQQLIAATGPLAESLELGIFHGKKILEIKPLDNSKAVPAGNWAQRKNWDFILAAGDDYTDEDTFKIMPEQAHTVKVGNGISAAHYRLPHYEAMLELLKQLKS